MDLREEEVKNAAEELKAYHGGSLAKIVPEHHSNSFVAVETADEGEKDSFKAIGIACDVSSESSVQSAFEEVIKEFGRVDAVVASAGKLHIHYLQIVIIHALSGIVENYSAFEYVHNNTFFYNDLIGLSLLVTLRTV